MRRLASGAVQALSSFARPPPGALVAAAAGASAAAAFAYCDSAHEDADRLKKKLKRVESEGVRRRDLVRCNGPKAALEENYQVFGQLGQGGFATVRLAKHRITGFLRAIKTVSADAIGLN